ncbi:hypothetical protein ID866_343 [Astraeus odoratus]|nr:hypothetical protein ID866_343 [Astraeus odoratus]
MTVEYLASPISVQTSFTDFFDSPYGSTPTTWTSPSSGSPEPCELEDLFSATFLPASLDDPTRDGPRLPQELPQLPPNSTPLHVAEADRETPDNWVKRNPELVRLTGKHPFNSEARLSSLFEAGFLTPAHLHFVRNHGAVPRVTEDMARAWTIRVHGLVQREVTFTLRDLSEQFPIVTLPITLMVHVLVLRHTAAWAMNGLPLEPDHGFPVRLVVPGQIGGRSVKVFLSAPIMKVTIIYIIGFGGSSVERDCTNGSLKDNKLLPTQVEPDQARAEKHWWYDPRLVNIPGDSLIESEMTDDNGNCRYIITELNVNSAIAKPDHDEKLVVSKHSQDSDTTLYSMRGYAYSGGGRRVTRVEVSLDNGVSWMLADIDYPEDRFREVCHADPVYGTLDLSERDTSFCWCFWTFDVAHSALAKCNALMVRASDEGSGMQPRDMYWHVLGMMNNWWFRVAVNKIEDGDKIVLHFEHPTLAGTASGGWMERLKASGQDITKPVFGDSDPGEKPDIPEVKAEEIPLTKPGVTRKITLEELKSQDREQPWFVVNGEVYDGTPFLKEHPGGGDSIILVAGEDASEDFFAIHSAEGKAKLAQWLELTIQKKGITPILQVLRSIFLDEMDTETKVWVISANKAEEDILCRDELDALFARHGPHRLKLHYVLSNASTTWTGNRGRVDEELLKMHMPKPSEQGIILVCGPDPMITYAVKPGLQAVGWDIENFLVVF